MNLLDLFAKISLDSSEYEEGLDNAETSAKNFGGQVKTALGTAGKVGAAAIGAITTASVAMTGAVVSGAKQAAAYGDNIDKMSQKMGISAEAYQEWDAILQHSGTSIDGLQRGLMTLNSAVEKGSDAFEKLGLSQEEVAEMSTEDLFSAVITGLQGMEEGSERTALAQQLLGGAAKELGPLLNTSAEDTEAMRQRVHELGGVLSDEAVKSAAAFQDSMQDLETAFGGLKRGLAADFMPALTDVMGGLTEIFSGDADSGIAMVSEGIDKLLTNITDSLPQFINTALAILDALLQAFIDNLPKLLQMGGKLIGQLVAGLIKAIPEIIKALPQIIKAIIDGLVSAWPDIRDAGADLIKQLGDAIMKGVDAAKNWGKDLIQNFIDGILGKWNDLKSAVSNVAGTIKDFLGFSEPEEGPLSNFHTFAPDMMALFAEGIKDNADIVQKQLNDSLAFTVPVPGMEQGGRYGQPIAGSEPYQQEPIPVIINLTEELDGAILARKTFRFFINEADRQGIPIIAGA